MARKPVEVVLEPSDGNGPWRTPLFFVCIKHVPWSKGLTITNAVPLKDAETIKAAVEQSLHDYKKPKPKPTRKRKPRTAWERLRRDILP